MQLTTFTLSVLSFVVNVGNIFSPTSGKGWTTRKSAQLTASPPSFFATTLYSPACSIVAVNDSRLYVVQSELHFLTML